MALTNLDDGTIQIYLSAKVVSERVKAALAEVVKRKHALEEVVAEVQQRQQQIRDIGEDQARIRQNMAQLDRNTDVYKTYVKKLSEQEAEIERVRGQIVGLTDQTVRLRKARRVPAGTRSPVAFRLRPESHHGHGEHKAIMTIVCGKCIWIAHGALTWR